MVHKLFLSTCPEEKKTKARMAGGQVAEEVDALLIQLAQRTGGIEPLLHCLFSFLKRKTDFYHIQQPGDRIGSACPCARVARAFLKNLRA